MSSLKIPFWVAIFININIVVGGAFFLGVQKITTECGLFAPFAWLLCGLMLVPLVAIFAHLARQFPQAGGIYVYSQVTLGQFWGYLSGITYFMGGIAGSAVLIREFVIHVQQTSMAGGFLRQMGLTGVYAEIFIALIFTVFNLFNIQFMGAMQMMFTGLKIIPIAVVLLGALLFFDISTLSSLSFNYAGFSHVLPTVFFAYIGIEACCAVIDKIKDGEKRGARLLWMSFGAIVLIYTVLQIALLCLFIPGTENPFLQVLPRFTSNETIIFWGNGLILSAILVSFLAGFYGCFYYNNWNIYAIAENKNIVGHAHFMRLNKNGVPWLCVLMQAVVMVTFLIASSSTEYLLTMSDFGITIAYILSTLAFFVVSKKLTTIMGWLGLLSCAGFMYIAGTNLYEAGFYTLVPFLLVVLVCLVLFRRNQVRHLL